MHFMNKPQDYDATRTLYSDGPEDASEIDRILDRAAGDSSVRKLRIFSYNVIHKRREILDFILTHTALETVELYLHYKMPLANAKYRSFVLALLRAVDQNKNTIKLKLEMGNFWHSGQTAEDLAVSLLMIAPFGVTDLHLGGVDEEASDDALEDITEAFSSFKCLQNMVCTDLEPAMQDAIMMGLSSNQENMVNLDMDICAWAHAFFSNSKVDSVSPNHLKIQAKSFEDETLATVDLTDLLTSRGDIALETLQLIGDMDEEPEDRPFPFQNAALFSYLHSAASLTVLHLEGVLDANGGTMIKDFLTNNKSVRDLYLTIDGSALYSRAFLSNLADGLVNNKGLVLLDLTIGDYEEQCDFAVVMRGLAQASRRKDCDRALETLVFRLVNSGVEESNRKMLCDILGPNCTLKTFVYHGGTECSADMATEDELIALLAAVQKSPRLEVFDARHNLQEWCPFVLPLRGVLPKLPPQLKEFLISYERPVDLGQHGLAQFKQQLLEDMEANHFLTRVKFMPYCWDDRDFDTKLQSYCTRNKFNRTYSDLRNGALPLAALPSALELTQQKGNRFPQKARAHTATLIFEGLQSVQGQVTLKEFAKANPSGGSEESEGTVVDRQPVPARCDNNPQNNTGTGDHDTGTKELKRKRASNHGDGRLCAACQEEKPLHNFSKNQRRKGSKGRCKDCMASN